LTVKNGNLNNLEGWKPGRLVITFQPSNAPIFQALPDLIVKNNKRSLLAAIF
jgi:hypothetical protein